MPLKSILIILCFCITVLSGCDDGAPVSIAPAPGERDRVDPERLARGQQLYQQNCAVCHQSQAAGDPQWRKQDSSGRFPPPPLNGTAHTWHHPWAQLHHTIKNGGPAGRSNMPAWKDQLTDQQIEDIMLWFQSLWPDEVYAAWYRMDQEAREQTQ